MKSQVGTPVVPTPEMTDDQLIMRWKRSRDQKAYDELKRRHSGLVYQAVNRYAASGVPLPTLEAQGWLSFDDTVNSYNPSSAAKFPTFLVINLKRIDRFVKTNQNMARIPEGLALSIGRYDRAKSKLTEDLGRDPNDKELARASGLTMSRMKQLEVSRRKDLFEGGFEGEGHDQNQETKGEQLLLDIRDMLSGQEREAYEYLTGIGRAKLSKFETSKRMRISPGRLSQITGNIQRKSQPLINKRLR